MPRQDSMNGRSKVRDVFVEHAESIAIHWTMRSAGSVSIRHGLRSGAGIRRRSRGGAVQFEALDDTGSGRLEERLQGLRTSPGTGTRPAARQVEPILADAAIDRTPVPGAGDWSIESWDDDIARVLAWLETAARGILTEVAAREIEARAHLTRQRIRVETPARTATDRREGARIEILASLEDSAPVRRRLAGGNAARLCEREPAEAAGRVLGRDLLSRRGGVSRPDGEFPVIFAAGACGALVHEIGHLLEDDHASLPDTSLVPGERIAPSCVRIVDDPSACEGRGSYRIDDEGEAARPKVLVENGVFVGTLGTTERSGGGSESRGDGADGTSTGGHSRRGSYRDLPLPRMACTFLAAGEEDPAAILSGTERGLFIQALRAGEVDPGSGLATLIVDGGSLIEGGRLTRALGECFLVVSVSALLRTIDAVGCDLAFDFGAGSCIKADQAVSVITGHPTFRAGAVRVVAP